MGPPNRLAKEAHTTTWHLPDFPNAPTGFQDPNFFMNERTPWTKESDFCEGDPNHLLGEILSKRSLRKLSAKQQVNLDPSLSGLSTIAPPSYPLKKSTVGFGITTQLQCRTGNLATAARAAKILADDQPSVCLFGCDTEETEQHIFLKCPHTQSLRDDATSAVVKKPRKL
jgi:hypothetical protein